MANRAIEYVYKLIDQYSDTIKKMSAYTKKFQMDADKAKMHAQKMAKGIGDSIKRFALVGITALGAGIAFSVKKASEMENSLVGFTTLLKGNSEGAKKLVNDLQVLGAETPFEFKDLADTTSMLMGFNAVTKETTIPTLRMLGDLSQGNAAHLQGVALAYGQIAAAGKADQMDIRQLINAQVPILDQLAKQWGVTVGEARKMIPTKGTFAEINKAMIAMTSTGGMFEGGMLRASKTFTGLWSTFLDSIGMTAAGFGEALLPVLKDFLIMITSASNKILVWVQANKDLIKTKIDKYIKDLVWTLTTLWKVFSVVFKIVKPFIPVILALAAGIWVAHKAYIVWQVAQWAINAAMTANPIGLIIVGIGALIASIILLIIYYKQVIAFTTKWWDRLKGLLMVFTPINAVIVITIEIIRSLAASWDIVIEKFKGGDILGAILEIGKAILRGVIAPIEALLALIDKIPFMKGITGKAFEGLDKIKETLGLNIGEAKNNELKMKGKEKAQVNVKTDLSVYTENGMKVAPFKKRDNLGYQMQGVGAY